MSKTDQRLRALRLVLLRELAHRYFPGAAISETTLMMAASDVRLETGLRTIRASLPPEVRDASSVDAVRGPRSPVRVVLSFIARIVSFPFRLFGRSRRSRS